MTQDQALTILKTGANVFLTGEPGSGKTHTINQFVSYLRKHDIQSAITASTGIAATHIGGQTIHSWSGIGVANYLSKYDLDRIASNKYVLRRVEPAKVLIIDEVSMLAPNTLEMVDAVCREVKRNQLPFGGLQIIFVGDFFQLPPIQKNQEVNIRSFAYESKAWLVANPVVCYLTEQHRQSDKDFNDLLNAIRSNEFNGDHLVHLEKRIVKPNTNFENIPKLFSHNADVDRINDEQLKKIAGQAKTFFMIHKGRAALVEGLKKSCLSPEKLNLKIKAAVMFTKNNPKEGFVNGTLGQVVAFDQYSGYPVVKTLDNQRITVVPMDWSIMDGERVLAKISQIPLRLAWAITVHKSQGMTLDAAVMDLRQVFEFGQGYVALSRVRALSGLHLLGWNDRTFQIHPKILEIDETFRQNSSKAVMAFEKMSESQIQKLHENFIRASGGDLEETEPETEDPAGDTYEKTLILWNQNKSLADIVLIRKLKQETILSHIEKLSTKGLISDLSRLVTKELSEILPVIHSAFEELGIEKLSPVFVKFNGKHSYNTLRLARMLFKKGLDNVY